MFRQRNAAKFKAMSAFEKARQQTIRASPEVAQHSQSIAALETKATPTEDLLSEAVVACNSRIEDMRSGVDGNLQKVLAKLRVLEV